MESSYKECYRFFPAGFLEYTNFVGHELLFEYGGGGGKLAKSQFHLNVSFDGK